MEGDPVQTSYKTNIEDKIDLCKIEPREGKLDDANNA